MKRVLVGIAAVAGVMLLAEVMVGALYLRSPSTPLVAGRAALVTSPSGAVPAGQPPAGNPLPSRAEVASPIALSKLRTPAVPSYAAPGCPPLVVTSFTATAAPDAVVVAWTISGGCNDWGWLAWYFDGTTYPGRWQIDIHGAMRTYTSHPQKPANAPGQQCLFSFVYELSLDGSAPGGGPVPVVFAHVSDLNLC